MKMVPSLKQEEVDMLCAMAEQYELHADRCDRIHNRMMANKQKSRDLQRADLLRRLANDLRPL